MTTVPQVHYNNYINIKNTSLDVLSKIFIILEFILGVNRMNIFGIRRVILNIATYLYSISIVGLVVYITIITRGQTFLGWVKLMQYAIYAIFGFATRKKLQKFYKELKNFDKQFGFTPKITHSYLKIALQIALIMAFTIFTINEEDLMFFAIINLINVLENEYYGHVLKLLIQRLRSVNLSIKSSLICVEIEKSTQVEKSSINIIENETKMSKFMDFYYTIVNAYDLLTDAIKFQVKIIDWFPTATNSSLQIH